ncbi:MAG: ribonuclease III [Acidobacteria bacterium]|nr:ribonuclease III [Acidobacteriota bacterium]
MHADGEAFESVLGHQFGNRELLVRALTHKSLAFEMASDGEISEDNEQLEFLGDAVLGFLVSDALVSRFASFPEGRLSKLKAQLVSASHLYRVALAIKLGLHLRVGRSEEMSGGREKKALLSDALEAVIAALYLDGGVEAARRFVHEHVIGEITAEFENCDGAAKDYKSSLQEMAQAMKLPPPRYTTVREQGPEHAKVFTVEVRLGRQFAGQAEGMSKKAAGQKAAEVVVRQLMEKNAELEG